MTLCGKTDIRVRDQAGSGGQRCRLRLQRDRRSGNGSHDRLVTVGSSQFRLRPCRGPRWLRERMMGSLVRLRAEV